MSNALIKSIQTKVGVAADGVCGPITLAAIAKALGIAPEAKGPGAAPNELISILLSVAAGEIGVKETSHNQGPGIAKYWTATSYPEGYKNKEPWCSSFLCWVFMEAAKRVAVPFKLPRSAAAFAWEEWARKEGQKLIKRPDRVKRGDVVIFDFSHIGICSGDSDENGTFESIEGNTNAAGEREGGAVMRKRRKISLVRSVVRLS